MRRATRRQEEFPIGGTTAYAGWRGFAAREVAASAPAGDFAELDGGRLSVERRFGALLRQNGIATFEALFDLRGGVCVRRIKNRSNTRIALSDGGGCGSFYLKRHERPHWRERLRPLLNFGRPVFGARNEWLAILALREAGVPTLTPVCFGEHGGRSLLVTEDLRTDVTLLDWVNRFAIGTASRAADAEHGRALIGDLARLTRRMHDAGIFHQDFFLHHILTRGEPGRLDLRVIDPGRALRTPRLPRRWTVKDLAQLNFSARYLSCADRLRFLRLYLGRPFRRSDRFLVRVIAMKSRRIAAHTAKHGLWVPGDPEAAGARTERDVPTGSSPF
jgi:heptose I phosphotransferase